MDEAQATAYARLDLYQTQNDQNIFNILKKPMFSSKRETLSTKSDTDLYLLKGKINLGNRLFLN